MKVLMILLVMLASCQTVKTAPTSCPVVNLKGFIEPMTLNEAEALKTAESGCVIRFNNSPCLTTFIKVAPGKFHALCGKSLTVGTKYGIVNIDNN